MLAPEWGPPRKRVAESKKPGTIPDVYYEYPERGIWLLIRDYRIARIGVESRGWSSADGLRVGMPVGDIFRVYGKGKVRDIEESDPKLKGLRYFLDYPGRGLTLLVLSKTQRVQAIHIYPPGR